MHNEKKEIFTARVGIITALTAISIAISAFSSNKTFMLIVCIAMLLESVILFKAEISHYSFKNLLYISGCTMMVAGAIGMVMHGLHWNILPFMASILSMLSGSIICTKVENLSKKNVDVMRIVPASLPNNFWMKDQK